MWYVTKITNICNENDERNVSTFNLYHPLYKKELDILIDMVGTVFISDYTPFLHERINLFHVDYLNSYRYDDYKYRITNSIKPVLKRIYKKFVGL